VRRIMLVGLAAIIAGCGGPKSTPAISRATSTSTSSSTSASASTSSEPMTLAPPSVAVTMPPPVAITGFGATTSDWNANHVADNTFTAGSVYNPDPSLPTINGHTGARYVTVNGSNGRITNYSMNLHAEPIAAAKAEALHEVPTDAIVLWAQTKDTCYQEVVTSATLAKAIGPTPFGDTNGGVFFEFSKVAPDGTSSYSAGSVNEVIVGYGSLGGPTAASATPC
jgi:hypothetical protein